MRFTTRYVALATTLFSFATAHPYSLLRTREVSPDNTCGTTGVGGSSSAFTCPAELPCCSVNGFCGSTPEYCCTDSGCQPEFGTCKASAAPPASPPDGVETPSPGSDADPERCGEGIGSCAAGKCCSLSGFCGTTVGMLQLCVYIMPD